MNRLFVKISIFCLVIGVFPVVKAQRLDRNQDYQNSFREATRNYLFGKYVQAISLYKECLRLMPESGVTHYQLSKIYLTAGNITLAREHAKNAVKFDETNKWYLQSLGDIYQFEEKYDSAVSIYERLLSYDPNNISITYAIGLLYEKIDKYSNALDYLQKIDDQIGRSKEVAMTRYRIYETLNQPEKAIKELKAASDLSPGEYSLSGMIAEYYQRHKMLDSASVYYKEIFPEYNSDANVVFSYAGFLLETGKVDSARILLLQVMNDSSTDNITKSGYFYNVLRDEQNFKHATPVIDTVTKTFLNNNESDIRALAVYADVFLRLRRFSEATWALTRIVDKDPSNYPATEQLIYTLNILGRTDSVLLYANRAIRMNMEKPLIYLFSGSAHYQKKNYTSAIVDLSKGLSLTDDVALKLEFYSLMGECYQQNGIYDKSEQAFKSALEIDENNLPVRNNYAYYLSVRGKNLKEALKLSKVTIDAEPQNPTYLDTYAWILYKMGKIRRSKKYILMAIEYGGTDNEEIMSHSAEIHVKLGQYAEAIKYLEKIVALPDKSAAVKATNRIKEVNSIMNR